MKNIENIIDRKNGNVYLGHHRIHCEKKGGFTTSLATQFLSCKGHLQLIIFICCKC
jgi:hypothetical protein